MVRSEAREESILSEKEATSSPEKESAPVPLYIAGPGAPSPGLYQERCATELTNAELLELAGIDLGKIAGAAHVAHSIKLYQDGACSVGGDKVEGHRRAKASNRVDSWFSWPLPNQPVQG